MKKEFLILKEEIEKFGLSVSDKQLNQFEIYYDMLIEWNEKINLTAITEIRDVIYKHFIDSVSLIKAVKINDYNSLIDVGTGGGFPGIPLKIMFPHLKVTLLDSLNKRLVFLDEVIKELGLTDIITVHGRAEDVSREKIHRQNYDICVSRAVANLSTLLELCTPFVKIGGIFAPYKSEKTSEEIDNAKNAIFLLGCELEHIEEFSILDNNRSIVCFKKKQGTSNKYPRKAGTPAKKPL